MDTTIHFIDVGQGNMVFIETSNGEYYIYDCNITNDNENRVLNYIAGIIKVGPLFRHLFVHTVMLIICVGLSKSINIFQY